jgi:SAM-dependent methyltransferase
VHLNSELLFRKYALSFFKPNIKVLEVGPSTPGSVFQPMVHDPSISWETADIAGGVAGVERVMHHMLDEYTIPCEEGTFDVVFSAQVLEHVRMIWRWMPELARVCKKGGHVITIAPTSWPYHEAPVDCWRVHAEGMRALNDHAGLQTVLVVTESLEPCHSRRFVYGAGRDNAPAGTGTGAGLGVRLKRSIETVIGWPKQVSLDTISVALRP